ncbi:MAG: GGDEF domain-containing protein [Candidatus Paceibacteria bacterium]
MPERIPRANISKIEGAEWHKGSPEMPPLSKEISDLVGIVHHFNQEELRTRLTEIADRVAELERKSRTDELTGLLNRGGFREEVQRLEAIFARGRRDNQIEIPTALLAIDLDGFKEVNDTCGHSCGDRCLELIAKHVPEVLREEDVFARIGGDEFSIFLTRDDEVGAAKVAERVRATIEGVVTETMQSEFPNYKGKLSASIGVVAIDGNGEVDGEGYGGIEKIMKHADYAAYVVKAAGKKGELTYQEARGVDADGQFERDFLAGKTLPR